MGTLFVIGVPEFDWTNEELIKTQPSSWREKVEFYLCKVFLLDPDKVTLTYTNNDEVITDSGDVIKLPRKFRIFS